MAFIYRRLALLAGAHAQVQPLARGWVCLISGHIGRNTYRAGEYYRTRIESLQRRDLVNGEGRALVVSIEEVMYPLSQIVVKWDATHQPVAPPVPPPYQAPLGEYSRVKDIYKGPRRATILSTKVTHQ